VKRAVPRAAASILSGIGSCAAALTLSACTAPPPALSYTVAVDPQFTTDQMDSITAGLNDWTAQVPELQITSSIAPCGSPSPHYVCFQPAHDAPDPSDDVIGATTPGNDGSATIRLYVDRIQATGWNVAALTEQTAAHEMGHAMGLKHSSAHELMAPDVPDQASSVMPGDVAQFWAVRGQ